MLKGYRTYLVSASGFFTGVAMIMDALVNAKYDHIGEGIVLVFTSAAQFYQRAAIDG